MITYTNAEQARILNSRNSNGINRNKRTVRGIATNKPRYPTGLHRNDELVYFK